MKTPKTKVCSVCWRRKLLDEFYKHPTARLGRQDKCKKCAVRRAQGYYSKTAHRAHEDKRVYGLTKEQKAELFKKQGGKCAVCRKPPKYSSLCVDHEHSTGRIRGLLCHNCNRGLGLLGDKAANLVRATAYLQCE